MMSTARAFVLATLFAAAIGPPLPAQPPPPSPSLDQELIATSQRLLEERPAMEPGRA